MENFSAEKREWALDQVDDWVAENLTGEMGMVIETDAEDALIAIYTHSVSDLGVFID